MGLNNIFAAIFCATLVAWSHPSAADEYRPGEFLGLDLPSAVLSPKPLGPATQFAPVADRGAGRSPRRQRAGAGEPKPRTRGTSAQNPALRISASDKPRGAARTKLARPRGNPLDAQAFDTRVQAWPCKSGGICNWK